MGVLSYAPTTCLSYPPSFTSVSSHLHLLTHLLHCPTHISFPFSTLEEVHWRPQKDLHWAASEASKQGERITLAKEREMEKRKMGKRKGRKCNKKQNKQFTNFCILCCSWHNLSFHQVRMLLEFYFKLASRLGVCSITYAIQPSLPSPSYLSGELMCLRPFSHPTTLPHLTSLAVAQKHLASLAPPPSPSKLWAAT